MYGAAAVVVGNLAAVSGYYPVDLLLPAALEVPEGGGAAGKNQWFLSEGLGSGSY